MQVTDRVVDSTLSGASDLSVPWSSSSSSSRSSPSPGDEGVERGCEETIETLRASGSENELGLALGALGGAKRLMGNDMEAAAIAQEALAILDRLGTLEEPDRLRHELAAEPV